jgi:hypothetical protein
MTSDGYPDPFAIRGPGYLDDPPEKQPPTEDPADERAAAPYLALTERKAREYAATGVVPWPFDLGALLEEYDRRATIVEAAKALVDHDRAKPALGKSITVWRAGRRQLLEALARALDTGRRTSRR